MLVVNGTITGAGTALSVTKSLTALSYYFRRKVMVTLIQPPTPIALRMVVKQVIAIVTDTFCYSFSLYFIYIIIYLPFFVVFYLLTSIFLFEKSIMMNKVIDMMNFLRSIF